MTSLPEPPGLDALRHEADGWMWSLLRQVLMQGGAIEKDDRADPSRYPSYEHLSAHLDGAARDRLNDDRLKKASELWRALGRAEGAAEERQRAFENHPLIKFERSLDSGGAEPGNPARALATEGEK